MSDQMALKIAIELMHVPSRARLLRSQPLPDGVLLLLRISAGEDEAIRQAVALTGRSLRNVHEAAAFFIEQILLAPDADSYRVLGAAPQAGAGELRRNVALLLRWLHPDRDAQGARSVFAGRVTGAWNDLKTPERRAAYDARRRPANDGPASGKTASASHDKRKRSAAAPAHRKRRERDGLSIYGAGKIGFLRRALSILLLRPIQ